MLAVQISLIFAYLLMPIIVQNRWGCKLWLNRIFKVQTQFTPCPTTNSIQLDIGNFPSFLCRNILIYLFLGMVIISHASFSTWTSFTSSCFITSFYCCQSIVCDLTQFTVVTPLFAIWCHLHCFNKHFRPVSHWQTSYNIDIAHACFLFGGSVPTKSTFSGDTASATPTHLVVPITAQANFASCCINYCCKHSAVSTQLV